MNMHALCFMICTIIPLCISSTFAQDLAQQYEKAYFLETAKGQPEEAISIYKQIIAASSADEDQQTIIQALERMLILHKQQHDKTLQTKIENFNLHPDIRTHIVATFGEPERYANNNKEYTKENLPHAGYSMYYADGLEIQTSFGKIHSLKFNQPIFSTKGLTIGSALEEVVTVYPPIKTEDYYGRQNNHFESGVMYTNITKTLDTRSYRTTNGISFFISNDKVTHMQVYENQSKRTTP